MFQQLLQRLPVWGKVFRCLWRSHHDKSGVVFRFLAYVPPFSPPESLVFFPNHLLDKRWLGAGGARGALRGQCLRLRHPGTGPGPGAPGPAQGAAGGPAGAAYRLSASPARPPTHPRRIHWSVRTRKRSRKRPRAHLGTCAPIAGNARFPPTGRKPGLHLWFRKAESREGLLAQMGKGPPPASGVRGQRPRTWLG